MNTKVEAQNYRLDPLKWIVVAILIALGVVGNWYFASQGNIKGHVLHVLIIKMMRR